MQKQNIGVNLLYFLTVKSPAPKVLQLEVTTLHLDPKGAAFCPRNFNSQNASSQSLTGASQNSIKKVAEADPIGLRRSAFSLSLPLPLAGAPLFEKDKCHES